MGRWGERMMDGIKSYEGKKVFLELTNGRVYTGRNSQIDDSQKENGLVWIYLVDKFGLLITIASGEIKFIQEERENDG